MVLKAAAKGDRVALDIVKRGAGEIAFFLTTCAEVLKMQKTAYRVAATGGLVENKGMYFDMIRRGLRKKHPRADLTLPRFPPSIGAALISLDVIGVEWTDGVVANLEKTLPVLKEKSK